MTSRRATILAAFSRLYTLKALLPTSMKNIEHYLSVGSTLSSPGLQEHSDDISQSCCDEWSFRWKFLVNFSWCYLIPFYTSQPVVQPIDNPVGLQVNDRTHDTIGCAICWANRLIDGFDKSDGFDSYNIHSTGIIRTYRMYAIVIHRSSGL